MESVFRFYIRTILRATSMMITNTEMTNWIIEKFSGSGGIRTHGLRVPSPLLYQLRYRALGAVREWILIYMAHLILWHHVNLQFHLDGVSVSILYQNHPQGNINDDYQHWNDQLNYWKIQWLRWDSNPRPSGSQSAALPTALPSLGSSAWVNPYLHRTCDTCDIM